MARVTKQFLEQRVKELEAEVVRLKEQLAKAETPKKDWLNEIWGKFADDPTYDEAMRLGREWRESFRPKPRKKRKTSNACPRHGSSQSAGNVE